MSFNKFLTITFTMALLLTIAQSRLDMDLRDIKCPENLHLNPNTMTCELDKFPCPVGYRENDGNCLPHNLLMNLKCHLGLCPSPAWRSERDCYQC